MRTATVIGINDYSGTDYPSLNHAVTDALEMATLLKCKFGYKVNVATEDFIDHNTELPGGDLLFWAGHGETDGELVHATYAGIVAGKYSNAILACCKVGRSLHPTRTDEHQCHVFTAAMDYDFIQGGPEPGSIFAHYVLKWLQYKHVTTPDITPGMVDYVSGLVKGETGGSQVPVEGWV